MAEQTPRDWRKVLQDAVRRDPRGKTGVAKRMGVSRPYVSRVLSRSIDPPSPKFVERVLALKARPKPAAPEPQQLPDGTLLADALWTLLGYEPLGAGALAKRLHVSKADLHGVMTGRRGPPAGLLGLVTAMLQDRAWLQQDKALDQPLLTGCTTWREALAQAVQLEPRGMTGVGKRMGVSPSYVSRVLTGHIETPSPAFVERVERLLMPVACPHLGEPITPQACRVHASRTFMDVAGSPGPLAHWRACIYCPHRPVPPEPMTGGSKDPTERAVFEAREAARQKAQPLRLSREPVSRRWTAKESRAQALAWLRKHGARSAPELGRELGMRTHTAYQALAALHAQGLVERLAPLRRPGVNGMPCVPYQAVARQTEQGRPEAAVDKAQGAV